MTKKSEYNRIYRAKHDDKYRARNEIDQQRAKARIYLRRRMSINKNARQAIICDIKRHLQKGRTESDIVCWTEMPLSFVRELISEITNGQAQDKIKLAT